ncbi:MAG TPA: acyl-CoA dehydrogenase family protein, partial [Thermoanaerobaculia bacterium]|nr:acyl-CoA dehydrogenase family protein [Thermoanaerobaculia bacterium]
MTPWLDIATLKPFLRPHHSELGVWAEEFAREHLAPRREPANDAEARQEARQIAATLGEAGWFSWAVPPEHGGRVTAPDLVACCLLREALAAASPLADAVFALQALGSMPITLGGSSAQQQRFLPGVVRGSQVAAFAMTEPEAGSDVSSLATTATRIEGGYEISGQKTFISNAGIADFYCVFAQMDPAAGARGIGAFVVPAARAGLRFVRPQLLSSPHPLGELALEGCRVDSSALIAGPGDGFKLGMRTLDRLRPTVAAAACGMAARALDEALRHARERKQFGRPLAEHQLVQEKLARMATDLTAARLLTYRAAAILDS